MSNALTKLLDRPAMHALYLRAGVIVIGFVKDFWKDPPPSRWPAWMYALYQKIKARRAAFAAHQAEKDAEAKAKAKRDAKAKAAVSDDGPEAHKVEHELAADEPRPWTADRFQVMEAMWGEGCCLPGGVEAIDKLTSPLGLNAEMSVLDLGAGLGDLARRVAEEFKCYVTGLEMNQTMAARGMVMSIAAGLSKKASVTFYDPTAYTATRKYDCVIARELFYRLIGKEKFFQAINSSLKNGGGQIVFTDYVLDPALREKPAIVNWLAKEKSVAPMTQLELIKTWKAMGYDMRIAEDQTNGYREQIVLGLAQLASYMKINIPDHDTKPNVVAEIDLWSRRLAAFHEGLKYYRFYGIKY